MSGTAKATVFVENDRVIVTEYRFAPGANTGWHKHAHDYVVVPLMDGKVRLETPTGPGHAEMKKGVPYFRQAGVEFGQRRLDRVALLAPGGGREVGARLPGGFDGGFEG